MATLPETAFEIHGGCFCSAIRYTISVPDLESRPKIPTIPSMEMVPINKVTERLPMITLDHCTSCRRIPGAIIQSWFICPQAWVQFSLQPCHEKSDAPIMPTTIDYLMSDKALQEKTYLTHFTSSAKSNRTFCGKCGTHLTFYHSGPQNPVAIREKWGPIFDVANGSLDREALEMEGFRPSRQAWQSDGIMWVKELLKDGEKTLLG